MQTRQFLPISIVMMHATSPARVKWIGATRVIFTIPRLRTAISQARIRRSLIYMFRQQEILGRNTKVFGLPIGRKFRAPSAAVIGVLVAVVLYRTIRRRAERSGGEGGDDGNPPAEAANPDKHKMMASIVVDLRMNDPSLQQRIDALGNRDSETELSMTDTEGTGEVAMS